MKSENAKDRERQVDAAVILRQIVEAKPHYRPFRSQGLLRINLNMDYDMARISIDLPIIEARQLIEKLKAI